MKIYLAAIALLSCLAHGKVYYSEKITASDLGKSFNFNSHTVEQPCLRGDVQYHPSLSGRLNYFQRVDETLIRRRTFGEVHGGVNLFIIAGSVSTSMTHRNATDSLSLTSQLHLEFEEGYDTLENRTLNNNIDIGNCGHSFIYQVNYGRDLFVNTRLHFKTEEDYKRFVIKVKIRLLFFKKTFTKVKEIEKYAENAVFSVDVNSNGPLPVRLQKQLNERPTYCSGSNISPCLDTLHELVSYTFDNDGLAKDLDSLEKVPRSFVVKSFQDSGHYGAQDWVASRTTEDEMIWRRADSYYGRAVRDLERAKAFLQVATDDEKVQAQIDYDQAVIKLADAEALKSRCFENPLLSECLSL
ncbi:hypothetical protein [Pseudoalteromonas luteoviolacea]|uniref:Uncharacterized protein n=1 Tax=Pseudoalteromonas luteoviolacea H33 TaxID=1365251 RepID=A0A167EQL7_9GAMM|nr:hypothetical protein [Pseudoalteromonas luteoviolacea]KZN51081.1 hypothetical protein N476_14395 [Pseudoalteromonas luteoviolacea H33]KZN72126.1 hypothetical protein N477_03030 [Pseudoalteromonas luteoviolacea H33-S]